MSADKKREHSKILMWLGILYAAFFFGFLILKAGCIEIEKVTNIFQWIGIATGIEWQQDVRNDADSLGFALTASFRLLLTVGSALGVVWIAVNLLKKKGMLMNVENVVRIRDVEVKGRLIKSLNDILVGCINLSDDDRKYIQEQFKEKLDPVFDISDKRLKGNLRVIFNEDIAEDISNAMSNEISVG